MARRPRKKSRYDRDPLYQPTTQLSGSRLHDAAVGLVNLQFRPAENALNREGDTTARQGTALIGHASDYYRQLAQDAAGHVSLQQAIGSQLAQRQQDAAARTQATLQQAGAEQDRRTAADQSLRGPGLEGGGAGAAAAELAAQQARAAAGAQTSQDAAAAGTGSYQQLADLSDRATAARGGEVTSQLINRLASKQADIEARRTDLAGQRGDATTKQVLDLRQSGFENLITAKSLGLKEADFVQTSADKAAQRKTQVRIAKINDLTRRENAAIAHGDRQSALDYRKRRDQEMKALGVGPYRPPAARPRKAEPVSAVQIKTGITNAAADLHSDPKLVNASPAARRRILRKRGAPPIVIQAALEQAQYGGLRPSTAAQLRRLGVRVPQGWLTAFSGPPTPG